MTTTLQEFKVLGDNRGHLVALEANRQIPFDVKRVYDIFDTKEDVERGFHAHLNCKQIAIAVKGNCTFMLGDGGTVTTNDEEISYIAGAL